MKDKTRRWIAALLVWVLPLQGIATVTQGVTMPAHFHIHAHHAAITLHPLHADDVIAYLDDENDPGLHATIGRHEHALGDVGVVYVGDDGDGTPGNITGKHGVTFDMLLPSWAMPAPPAFASIPPPAMTMRFASHPGDRLDRPPR